MGVEQQAVECSVGKERGTVICIFFFLKDKGFVVGEQGNCCFGSSTIEI